MFDRLVHDFVAKGNVTHDRAQIAVTVSGSYHKYGLDSIECTIAPDAGNWPDGVDPLETAPWFEFKGTSQDGREIWIFGLSNAVSHGMGPTYLTGNAQSFLVGKLSEFDATNGNILCQLFIPPTHLGFSGTSYVKSYDGTITFSRDTERKAIRWNSKWGEAELIDLYEYHDEKSGLDSAQMRIARCQILLHLRNPGRLALGQLLTNLRTELDDTTWLLSFLARRRIAVYRVEATFHGVGKAEDDFYQTSAFYESWLGFERKTRFEQSKVDLLVWRGSLQDGLFSKLLDNLEKSEYKTAIRRTMPYVLMTHEDGYLEAHLGGIYAALETLVAGLSSDENDRANYIMDKPDFRVLADRIRATIRANTSDEDIVKKLSDRVGNINQPSFADRLIFLLDKHNVNVACLWPIGTDLKSELKNILQRRNLYIHQGKLDDQYHYLLDFYRLQGLVELWILRLLDCPDDALFLAALNRNMRIN